MSFFGMAYLGPPSPYTSNIIRRHINDISDEQIRAAFARTERLQGKGSISIDELRILLSYVYDGVPPEREVALLTRVVDLQIRGPQVPGEGSESGILVRVTLEDLMRAVEVVRKEVAQADEFRQIAGVANVAREFSSHAHFSDHRHKHQRSHYAPQDRYVRPQTSSQEIGWFAPAMVERVDRKPNKSCPETQFAAKLHLLQ